MFRVFVGLAVAAWAGSALADDQPSVAPAGSWVKAVDYSMRIVERL